jgi:hypothetical protein
MLAHLENDCWYLRNEVRGVQRLSHPQHEIVAREVHGDRLAAEEKCLEGDRGGVQVSDQLREDGLQVRVGRIAVRISCTPLEEDVKSPPGCLWYAREGIHLRGRTELRTTLRRSAGYRRMTVSASRVPWETPSRFTCR